MKKCPICNKIKDLNEFNNCKATKDKHGTYCKKCTVLLKKKWDKENPDHVKKHRKSHYKKNIQKYKEKNKENYKKTKDVRLKQAKIYRDSHKEELKLWKKNNPEKVKAIAKRAYKKNPAKKHANTMKRYTNTLKRTPKWLTKDQHKEMEQFYIKSKELEKETGIKHNVDHIIPLQGKNVSGLHVPWNLQVITKLDNIKKNNKF